VKRITVHHLDEVRRKIADLRKFERVLAEMAAQCDGGTVPKCPVIDALFDQAFGQRFYSRRLPALARLSATTRDLTGSPGLHLFGDPRSSRVGWRRRAQVQALSHDLVWTCRRARAILGREHEPLATPGRVRP